MTDEDIKALGIQILETLKETNQRLDAVEQGYLTKEDYRPSKRRLIFGNVLSLVVGVFALVALVRADHIEDQRRRDSVAVDRRLCEAGNQRGRAIGDVLDVFSRTPGPDISIPGVSAEQLAEIRHQQQLRFDEAKARVGPVDCDHFVPGMTLKGP